MRWVGNFFWWIFGGLILGILWGLTGLVLCITIIGIPFGVQCFKIASFVFAPSAGMWRASVAPAPA